jgi:predicted transcriptional regulator
MVYSGKIKVFKTPVDEVIKRLKEEKLVEMDGSYKYLLGIPISAFTTEEISDLHEHIVKLEGMIRDVSSTSEISMWTKELDELEVEYRKNDAV